MLWGVNWYYWLILALSVVLLIFVWRKAMQSSKERRERLKKEAAIWQRDYDLRQKFNTLTEKVLLETEESELLHGAAMNIQIKLENETDMNTAFNALPIEKKYIYTLEYFDEDAKQSLSLFFKNNGAPLVPLAPDALSAIGAGNLVEYLLPLMPMYDPDSDVSIDYSIVSETDAKFKEVYNSNELCKLAALYIKRNKNIFISQI